MSLENDKLENFSGWKKDYLRGYNSHEVVKRCVEDAKTVVGECPNVSKKWKEEFWDNYSAGWFVDYATSVLSDDFEFDKILAFEDKKKLVENLIEFVEVVNPKKENVKNVLKESLKKVIKKNNGDQKKIGEFLSSELVQYLFDYLSRRR